MVEGFSGAVAAWMSSRLATLYGVICSLVTLTVVSESARGLVSGVLREVFGTDFQWFERSAAWLQASPTTVGVLTVVWLASMAALVAHGTSALRHAVAASSAIGSWSAVFLATGDPQLAGWVIFAAALGVRGWRTGWEEGVAPAASLLMGVGFAPIAAFSVLTVRSEKRGVEVSLHEIARELRHGGSAKAAAPELPSGAVPPAAIEPPFRTGAMRPVRPAPNPRPRRTAGGFSDDADNEGLPTESR